MKYLVRCFFQHTPETRAAVVYYGRFDSVMEACDYVALSEAQGCHGDHTLLTESNLPIGCRVIELATQTHG